jgi:hypothetical protein
MIELPRMKALTTVVTPDSSTPVTPSSIMERVPSSASFSIESSPSSPNSPTFVAVDVQPSALLPNRFPPSVHELGLYDRIVIQATLVLSFSTIALFGLLAYVIYLRLGVSIPMSGNPFDSLSGPVLFVNTSYQVISINHPARAFDDSVVTVRFSPFLFSFALYWNVDTRAIRTGYSSHACI